MRRLSPLVFLAVLCPCLVIALPARAQWTPNGIPVDTTAYQYPNICSDGTGGAIVSFSAYRYEITDGDIYAHRFNAAGVRLWNDQGAPICTADLYQVDAVMAPDGVGGAVIAWRDARVINDERIYAQRVDAAGHNLWTPDGVRVTTQVGNPNGLAIVPDGAGGAIIVWSGAGIHAQRVNAAGSVLWTSAGIAVSQFGSDPAIIPDGVGGAIIAWADTRTAGNFSDIYAQRVDAAGNLQWLASGVPVSTLVATDEFDPALVTDNAGGAIVVYGGSRIRAQRINPAGVVQWITNGVTICSAPGLQAYPTAVADGTGGAIAAWFDQRNDFGDIYAQKVNSAGEVQWDGNGVGVGTGPDHQRGQALVSDGAGGAIVSWWTEIDDPDPIEGDVYVQRITVLGTRAWVANGVPASNSHLNRNPAMASDGNGGAFITWLHLGGAGTGYAALQRISPAGLFPSTVSPTPALLPIVVSNRPNPFSTSTIVNLTLPRDAVVSVDVFDVAGRRVRTIDGGAMAAGASEFRFDGMDTNHRALASGVYFLRVHAEGNTFTRKIVITR